MQESLAQTNVTSILRWWREDGGSPDGGLVSALADATLQAERRM
jgi:hypothetical protein